MVRDAVGVELPFSPLASPDCQGLCPVCGGDRNLGECPGDTRASTRGGPASSSCSNELETRTDRDTT